MKAVIALRDSKNLNPSMLNLPGHLLIRNVV